jgi:hypothetical protein
MDRVEKFRMRMHRAILLAVAAASLAGCDERRASVVGSLGAPTVGGVVGGVAIIGTPFTFFVTPSIVTLFVGQSVQLVLSVPDTLATHVQWSSLQPRVAAVTNTGLVTALGVGTATVAARLTADTNVVAPATILVSGPVVIPGVFIP